MVKAIVTATPSAQIGIRKRFVIRRAVVDRTPVVVRKQMVLIKASPLKPYENEAKAPLVRKLLFRDIEKAVRDRSSAFHFMLEHSCDETPAGDDRIAALYRETASLRGVSSGEFVDASPTGVSRARAYFASPQWKALVDADQASKPHIKRAVVKGPLARSVVTTPAASPIARLLTDNCFVVLNHTSSFEQRPRFAPMRRTPWTNQREPMAASAQEGLISRARRRIDTNRAASRARSRDPML